MNFLKSTLALLIVTFALSVQSSEFIHSDKPSSHSISPNLQWFKASAFESSLTQVLELPNEVWMGSPDESMTLGLVEGTYWLRFSLEVGSGESRYVFNAHNSSLNSIELYQKKPSGEVLVRGPIGTHYSYSGIRDLDVEGNKFILNFSEKGQHEFWIKIQHDGFFDAPIKIHSMTNYFEEELKSRFFKSIFYGFCLALGLYHFFYYLIMRDPIYLGLLMFTSGLALMFGCIDGVLFKYVWPQLSQLNDLALKISVPLVSISIYYLSFKFLQRAKGYSGLGWLEKSVFVANILSLVASFFIPVYASLYLSLVVAVVTLLVVKVLSVSSFWKYRDSISLIFLTSLTVFVLCTLCVVLGVVGLFPIDINDFLSGLKCVMSVQALVFAVAVVLRIKVMKIERKLALKDSQAKSEVLARVSHELRTPLNGILGLSHIMTPLLSDKKAKQYNAMVSQSATALLTVINDLLDVSSINAGKFCLNSQATDVTEVLRNVSETLFLQLDKSKVEGRILISSDVPSILLTDSDRLRQVLSNLLGNAIKHTEQGCITVTLSCLSEEDKYRFSVEDTGVGISLDKQEKIFNPYVYGNSSTGNIKSTGLGLFIAVQIAKAMDTKIEIESVEGKGSHFWFDLKMLSCEELSDRDVTKLDSLQPFSILVAEDNTVNQLIIVKLLENMGHSVLLAENGLKALELLRMHRFDLVIMDCDMPVMDGYEAVERWRSEETERVTPIIALTAHAYEGHEAKILHCGMDGQLLKPIKPAELQNAIYRYISTNLDSQLEKV